MRTNRRYSFFSLIYASALTLTAWSLTACSSAPKVLSVKSYPAEAEVCVKGRAGNDLFGSKTTCIGQTPFESDHFEYVSDDGKKHHVNFNELKAQDNFYLILKKDGYATQSVTVPSWDQFLSLNREAKETPVVSQAPIPIPAPAPAPTAPATLDHPKGGSLRILSNPPGALVYINGSLQGNTPYVYQYPLTNGQGNTTGGVKVKLESPGYGPFERMVNLNQNEGQEINFQMDKTAKIEAAHEERTPASTATEEATDDDGALSQN